MYHFVCAVLHDYHYYHDYHFPCVTAPYAQGRLDHTFSGSTATTVSTPIIVPSDSSETSPVNGLTRLTQA